jgi:hypothetical protein
LQQNHPTHFGGVSEPSSPGIALAHTRQRRPLARRKFLISRGAPERASHNLRASG